LKRVLIIIGIILGFVLSGVGTFLVSNHFHNKETEQLSSQIATLNADLAAIGPIVTCYTVQAETYAGQEFTEELIIEQSIPSSFTNDSFPTREEILNHFSRVSITPGTPITDSLIMPDEPIPDSLREIDITGNRWPIGLKEGDYVDLRITYPRGEDFIVLSHKRVMSITDQTLKVHMTEEEQMLYQAALVDFYTTRTYGSDMYLTKYVEPGLQQSAATYYSVPRNIATMLTLNPNIVQEAEVALKQQMRELIELARAEFPDEDDSGGEIKGGRDELNSKVNSDYVIYEVEEEKEREEAESGGDDGQSSLITDVSLGVS